MLVTINVHPGVIVPYKILYIDKAKIIIILKVNPSNPIIPDILKGFFVVAKIPEKAKDNIFKKENFEIPY